MSSVKDNELNPTDPELVSTKQVEVVGNSTIFLPNQPLKNKSKKRLKSASLLIGRFLLDLACINLAFVLAFLLRYNLQIGSEVLDENQAGLADYSLIELGFSVIFFIILQFKGFYRMPRNTGLLDEAGIIFQSALITVAVEMIIVFIGQPLSHSRLMMAYLVPTSFAILFAERIAIALVVRWQWKRGIGVVNLAVIGATDSANRLMQALVENPKLGYHLVGYIDDEKRFSEWTLAARYRTGEFIPHIGPSSNLLDLIQQHQIEQVIIALPANLHEVVNRVINQCREADVGFTLVPDIFELRLDSLNFQQINGVPVIGLKGNSLTGWNYIVKRISDVVLAALVLIVCLIPFTIITIAIKLDSPGPIIHKQIRIGKNGRPFTFYKFRSMYVNADAMLEQLQKYNTTGGATFKMVEDPRRTKVGRWLRRTSLDELPQVFNILFGQMSWVGPRPAMEREISKFQDWQLRRFEVTPGLTGLWQVSGRSDLPFEDMVKLDIYYAENWSLWLDLKILIRTIPAVLSGRGAY